MDPLTRTIVCREVNNQGCESTRFKVEYDLKYNSLMLICEACGSRLSHNNAATKIIKNIQNRNLLDINEDRKVKMFRHQGVILSKTHILSKDLNAVCNSCIPSESEILGAITGTIMDCECKNCIKRIRNQGYGNVKTAE